MLGRARRSVLLCDTGAPRNAATRESHGFLSVTAPTPPSCWGRARAARPLRRRGVAPGRCGGGPPRRDHFQVMLQAARPDRQETAAGDRSGRRAAAHSGTRSAVGRSVFNCLYCDGWEVRDQPLAVLGGGQANLRLAALSLRWSTDLVWCTSGPDNPEAACACGPPQLADPGTQHPSASGRAWPAPVVALLGPCAPRRGE